MMNEQEQNEQIDANENTPATQSDTPPEQSGDREPDNPRLAKVSEEAKRYRLRVRELEKQVESLAGERDASTASVNELREQADAQSKRHEEQIRAMRVDVMASLLGGSDAARRMDGKALAELSDRLGDVLASDQSLQQEFEAAFEEEHTSGRLERLGRLASKIIEAELEAHPYMLARSAMNPILRRSPSGGTDPTRNTMPNPIERALAERIRG